MRGRGRGNGRGPPPNVRSSKSSGGIADFFDEHISFDEATAGISNGRLLSGILRVNPMRRKVAYITCSGVCVDVMIEDDKRRNRSLHGDLVAVELLSEDLWLPLTSLPAADGGDEEVGAGCSPIDEVASVLESVWRPKHRLLVERKRDVVQSSSSSSSSSEAEATHAMVSRLNHAIRTRLLQPTGQVVSVLESRSRKTQVGCLEPKSGEVFKGGVLDTDTNFVFFSPLDKHFPSAVVPRMQLTAEFVSSPAEQATKIFMVDYCVEGPSGSDSSSSSAWSRSSKLPEATNVRSLGQAGSIEAETKALLQQNNICSGAFTDDMLEPLRALLGNAAADAGAWSIPQSELVARRDLRQVRIFTIDPPSARDLDDALHITPLGQDVFEIGVHIADVSYFLQQGTALDREARERATSTYLVQRVVPMLPSILCEQLCSLNPNVDRLAFSCIFKIRADGTLVDEDPWFGRTVIRSCCKLDYPTAQRMIEGSIAFGDDGEAALEEELWEQARRPIGHLAIDCCRDVVMMHKIAVVRRDKRLANGALVLSRSKLSFKFDGDGNPCDVCSYAIRDSNRLVEEYMLLANYLAAEKLLSTCGSAAFLRHHPEPKLKGLADLESFCEHLSIPMDTSSAMALQLSLKEIIAEHEDRPAVVSALSSLLTHPMNLASYSVAGNTGPKGWRHYALAIPYYTHFTSPIRRYADVVVHRLLQLGLTDPSAAAAVGDSEDTVADLGCIARNCNDMKANAKAAQERSDRVFLSVYVAKRPLTVEATVIGIGEKSFSFIISEFGIEQRMFVDEIDSLESSSFDAAGKVMTIERRGLERITIRYLTTLTVRLTAKKSAPIDVLFSLVGKKGDYNMDATDGNIADSVSILEISD